MTGLKRFIIEQGRRLAAGVAAGLMLFTGVARATGLEGLEAAYREQGIRGEASLSLGAWPDVSPETLGAMQAWLAFLRLNFYAGEGQSGLTLLDGSREVLAAENRQTGADSSLTLTIPGGLAPTEYVGTAEAPPMQTLFGAVRIPDFWRVIQGMPRLTEALTQGLVPFEKQEDTKVTLKNVGRAQSGLSYVLSAQEAEAWWQQALPQVRAIWAEMALGLPPDWRMAVDSALETLHFTGRLTVRRLLDGAGHALGFQVTAPLEALGQRYKLDLSAGFRAETGFYLNLKLPATRGKDRLEALISLAFDDQEGAASTRGDYSLSQVLGGDKRALSGKVDLALAAGERLSGEITAQVQRTGDAPLKRGHRFMPDFSLRGNELTGSLHWAEAEGKRSLREMTLALRVIPGAGGGVLRPQARVDLRNAAEADRAYAARQAADGLLPYLQEKLLTLPQATRLLVLHDWGRVRRALGEAPAVPAPQAQPDTFTVADDTDTQP